MRRGGSTGVRSGSGPLPGVQRAVLVAWGTLLLGLLVYPLFGPGQLALRDMLVLDQPALSPAALGFGDLPARNAPQDGLLALVGMIVPASWFARGLIVVAGALGAIGASWLARSVGGGAFGRAAAMTVVLWNPFVVERFLQGHWSLVIAAWLLPLVAVAALQRRLVVQLLAMWLASLTPTGALFALVTAVFSARGWRARMLSGVFGLVVSLPWAVPGLLAGSTGSGLGAAAFAPRAETFAGTLGSLLGLGGIWNADAVPASRQAGFALLGVILFAVLVLGVRKCPRPLLLLAGLGLGGAVAAWLAPELTGWAFEHVPGAGLLRDAQKLVMLALPAYAALAGIAGSGGHSGVDRRLPALAVIALALLQVPDAPRAMQQLSPIHVPVDERLVEWADGRDVLIADADALTVIEGRVVVEPHTKALSMVESGALVVDGRVVDPPSERWVAAQEAWAERDMQALADMGVGVVAEHDRMYETGAEPQRGWSYWLGIGLLVAWLLVPVGVVVRGLVAGGRGVRGLGGRQQRSGKRGRSGEQRDAPKGHGAKRAAKGERR